MVRTASYIREAATEVFGILRGNYGGHKRDCWWNEEVKREVKSKKVV